MKIITREIQPFQEKDFFFPLRDKLDYTILLMNSARLLLINILPAVGVKSFPFKLIINKMSRLFFFKEGKYFSVSFPFNVEVCGNEVIEVTTYSGTRVDNQIISSVLSILNNTQFRLKPSPIDFWIDLDGVDSTALSLLEEIFHFEPSYIRYDLDTENEKGKLHPLNHLDVNYSSYGTYKLGLKDIIIESYFENILNISTDCSFLTD